MVPKFSRAVVSGCALIVLVATPIAAAAEDDARPVNPFEGKADIVPEGNSLFNQYCSHCHGPNAEQGERPRDLRRLRIRYGDDAIAVFYKTVSTGRLDKGMPIWKGIVPDEVLWKIFTFLSSIQKEP